jgi:hypothetical protein
MARITTQWIDENGRRIQWSAAGAMIAGYAVALAFHGLTGMIIVCCALVAFLAPSIVGLAIAVRILRKRNR